MTATPMGTEPGETGRATQANRLNKIVFFGVVGTVVLIAALFFAGLDNMAVTTGQVLGLALAAPIVAIAIGIVLLYLLELLLSVVSLVGILSMTMIGRRDLAIIWADYLTAFEQAIAQRIFRAPKDNDTG